MFLLNIQNDAKFNFLPYQTSDTSHTSNFLTEAIKAYKDEYLTGLTDEERAIIEKEIKNYLKSLPKGQKVDAEALNQFVIKLLRQYGFKGDLHEMGATLLGEVKDESSDKSSDESSILDDAKTAYEKLTSESSNPSFFNNTSAPQEVNEEEKTVSQTISNPDGSKSIVVMRGDTIIFQVKISECSLFEVSSSDLRQYGLSADSIMEA